MPASYLKLRNMLSQAGLWPESRLARIACYLLGLATVLFALERLLGLFAGSLGEHLGGWVEFLAISAGILFSLLAFRWLKQRLLWRLRNRLIVTYIFIGVIPVALLLTMGFITLYLLAGQFSGFVVTSELDAQMRSLESANAAIGNELAARLEHGEKPAAESLLGLKSRNRAWGRRHVYAWYDGEALPPLGGAGTIAYPDFFNRNDNPGAKKLAQERPFHEIVRDGGQLYLRTGSILALGSDTLTVVASEPLDKNLMGTLAASLGEIGFYATGIKAQDTSPTFMVGSLPAPSTRFDQVIHFGTPLRVVDWKTGESERAGAVVSVQTRPSVLYDHLFASLGDVAAGIESILLGIAIFFALIELVALFTGTRMTRTVTASVAQLYDATMHVNRADFSHRIPVKSHDQLAELAVSFNSMTASIEQLIREQKEKQRLENELAIAQEVQDQLFPRQVSGLESLEVHGFCRPARTVSGDYYDFLTASSQKMILAVGDISGKGISAALLMATIHSAVRAYSIENIRQAQESVAVGAVAGRGRLMAAWPDSMELSPSVLLGLLNHQLYESTAPEKYATLFLGMYDAQSRHLTYSNGGHLPPLLIAEQGAPRRLDMGGTVVGLFDNMPYEEGSVEMHPGEVLVAYSDGVTEPENDFGEFGEQRLIDIVRENRHLPLPQISQAVTMALDDWIGDNEQPDDVTLVLARVR
jgi:phosphoserine phosphatase RsbU/P